MSIISEAKIYSVSEITEKIQEIVEGAFEKSIWIEGEISNFRIPITGHYYMSLKDEKAQIKAVMFKGQNRSLPFTLKDGLKVIAKGKLRIYPPRGEYQLIVEKIEPVGIGALALRFEQLKRKLYDMGIFDQKIKRPIPFLPQKVAVITSPSGAAIRDFLKVIRKRFANLEITIVPVRVQGEGATEEIVEAIDLVNRILDVDIIVLTRGGGSIEDLWAFNREEIAFAIRRSKIPVVSAVGHEIDVTISDLAADLRAPTPSAAAEMLVKEKETLVRRLKDLKERLVIGIKNRIRQDSLELERIKTSLKDPIRMIQERYLKIDDLYTRCIRSVRICIEKRKENLNLMRRALIAYSPFVRISREKERISFQKRQLFSAIMKKIEEKRSRIIQLKNRLEDLSPFSVLKRGYSITVSLSDNRILRDAAQVKKGEKLRIILAKGTVISEVVENGKEGL